MASPKKEELANISRGRSSLVYTDHMEYEFTIFANLPDIPHLVLLVLFISFAWRTGYSTERVPRAYI